MNKKALTGLGILSTTACIMFAQNIQADELGDKSESSYIREFNTKQNENIYKKYLINSINTTHNLKFNTNFYKDYLKDNHIEKGYQDYKIYNKITLSYENILRNREKFQNTKTNLKEDLIGKVVSKILVEAPVNKRVKNYTITADDIDIYVESDYLMPEVVDVVRVYQNGYLIYHDELNIYDRTDKRVYTDLAEFKDVAKTHWVYDYVQTLKNDGIVEGSNGNYNPSNNVTRAQFAMMLARTLPFVESGLNENDLFSDTSKHNAKKEIALLYQLGVIKGYEDGTFKPNAPITRQQAVVMIDRFIKATAEEQFAGLVLRENMTPFKDENKISTEALPSVQNIYGLKIIDGSNGEFNPSGKLTRAHMAKILVNLLNLELR